MTIANGTIRGKGGIDHRPAILYPLMVIAAIAVIIFSVAGIATMLGWLPSVHSRSAPTVQDEPAEPGSMTRAAPPPARPASVRSQAATGACDDCGVIESVRTVEARGRGTGSGAIGGAVVANEIEKSGKTSVSYQVRVRMNDGTIRTFYEHSQPALGIGQKVRVRGQEIITG